MDNCINENHSIKRQKTQPYCRNEESFEIKINKKFETLSEEEAIEDDDYKESPIKVQSQKKKKQLLFSIVMSIIT